MEERKMEDLIIDYVEGTLKGELKEHVERIIEKDVKWKQEYEELVKLHEVMETDRQLTPDASLETEFHSMLKSEIDTVESKEIKMAPTSNPWLLRIAASVALISIGTVIGVLIMRNQQNAQELAALKAELEETKQLVFASLENQSSASRLKGINVAMVMDRTDDEIINVLVNTMNTDDNTNVRLAAVAALARFADEAPVRQALIDALETQDDPVVAINLINLMVRLKESKAVEPLKNLLEKEDIHGAIKAEAHLGILELS